MALIKCPECKNLISNTAPACPTCGHSKPKSYSIWSLLGLIFLGWITYHFYVGYTGYSNKSDTIATNPAADINACSIDKIKVEINTFAFKDECKQSSCFYMKGAATIKNTCEHAIGAQLKITGFDASNKPVSTNEFWPNSTRNLPTGDTVISLDQALDYNPSITQISLTTTRIKDWKK